MPAITFEAKPYKIGDWLVLKLPQAASDRLTSRSQVYVKGEINGLAFQAALEPDGDGSHWLHIDKTLGKVASVGKTAKLEIESIKDWPEPNIPTDIKTGVAAHPDTKALWDRVTPMARFEWIRWITSTKNPDTRKKRIEVSRSKLLNGLRRPCCFNRSMCCVPDVSKNGILISS